MAGNVARGPGRAGRGPNDQEMGGQQAQTIGTSKISLCNFCLGDQLVKYTNKLLPNYFEKFPALFAHVVLWSCVGLVPVVEWQFSCKNEQHIGFSQCAFHNELPFFT